jgi:hypothetical protein
MHYKRHTRHGHFDETRRWHPKSGERRVCEADGCTVLEDGNCGMCKLHDTRRRRHGDPRTFIHQRDRNLPRGSDNHLWTGDEATYFAVHQRVRKARGSASTYVCGCGRPAKQWAYDHSDPEQKYELIGATMTAYSIDVERYEAKCVRCHKRADMERIKAKR